VALELRLDYDRGIPIYRQIYEAVVAALATGALDHGEQLPTIHELAGRLEVNPNTVARAYGELERDGYIVGKRGVGTFPAHNGDDPAAPPAQRERVLRGIFERAWAEAARHRIGIDELRAYFRKAKP
jgi:GntR family transcriptional regulator